MYNAFSGYKIHIRFDTRYAVWISCRANVAPMSNLIQLGSAQEWSGVWTRPYLWVRSFGMIQIRSSDPRSLGSWRIKGTEESFLRVDFSVRLMRHDLSDLRSLILIWIIPKERTLYLRFDTWLLLCSSLIFVQKRRKWALRMIEEQLRAFLDSGPPRKARVIKQVKGNFSVRFLWDPHWEKHCACAREYEESMTCINVGYQLNYSECARTLSTHNLACWVIMWPCLLHRLNLNPGRDRSVVVNVTFVTFSLSFYSEFCTTHIFYFCSRGFPSSARVTLACTWLQVSGSRA